MERGTEVYKPLIAVAAGSARNWEKSGNELYVKLMQQYIYVSLHADVLQPHTSVAKSEWQNAVKQWRAANFKLHNKGKTYHDIAHSMYQNKTLYDILLNNSQVNSNVS